MTTASDETQSDVLASHTWSRRGVGAESRRALVGLALVASDWVTLSGVFVIVWLFRRGVLPLLIPSVGPGPPLLWHFPALYYFAPWIASMAAGRLYSRHSDFWEEVRTIVRASSLGTVMALLISYSQQPGFDLSRFVIVAFWLASLPALALSRYGMKRLLAFVGLWQRDVLVVGDGEAALQIIEGLKGDPTLGYGDVVVVSRDGIVGATATNGLALAGSYDCIPGLLEDRRIREVIVAVPDSTSGEVAHIAALCEGRVDTLRVMPDIIGMAVSEVETETLGGHLLISMRSNLGRPSNLLIKRTTDLVGSALLLVPTIPLVLVIAALIRAESNGPVFFLQKRVGRHGRLFSCYKFRTMHLDADQRLEQHLANDPEARQEWDEYKKLRGNDPRVTKIGGRLRHFSLDELPQLLNVLRGEMSLVGPRPYIDHELEGHEEAFKTILLAWPGISGLWQVSGRNKLTMMQRIRLDEFYVRNWSLWLDLQIALRTVGVLIRRDGAY